MPDQSPPNPANKKQTMPLSFHDSFKTGSKLPLNIKPGDGLKIDTVKAKMIETVYRSRETGNGFWEENKDIDGIIASETVPHFSNYGRNTMHSLN